MVALSGESFLIQAYIIGRAPESRKTFSRAPARNYDFLEEGRARPTPQRWRAREGYFTGGLSSACSFGWSMFALVTRFAPVSTFAGTFSPFETASPVFTPS